MENKSREAIKISKLSIVVNLLLSAGKLAAGLLAHSGAMISDAVHSASDVFSTFVVIIGVKLSGKESDKEHPYGHERLECVAAIILSGILLPHHRLGGRAEDPERAGEPCGARCSGRRRGAGFHPGQGAAVPLRAAFCPEAGLHRSHGGGLAPPV